MTSANSATEKELLDLAAKVLSGTASAEEKGRLETCVHTNPEFRKAFEHMQAIIETEKDDRFLQAAIRVSLKKANPAEEKEIASLEFSNPAQWRRYRFINDVFVGLAREAELGESIQREPMPDRVRQALRAELRKAKS